MKMLTMRTHVVPIAAAVALVAAGCTRDTSTLPEARSQVNPIVFLDEFTGGLDYQAFLNTNTNAVQLDETEAQQGTASLKITVPKPRDPSGAFAGGAATSQLSRDFTGFNALTFWAKSSINSTLDVVGLGNDNTGTSLYEAAWSAIPLTTQWQQYVIPIPFPGRLEHERGLMYFAEGAETPTGHFIWFDEIQYEMVPGVGNPRPSMDNQTVSAFVGATVKPTGTRTIFRVNGADQLITHSPGYFTYTSSDEAVATVKRGQVVAVGPGEASIGAMLGEVPVTGEVTLKVTAPPPDAPPTPTHPPGDVISLFSDVYVNEQVDTWSANWDRADVTDLNVQGVRVKAYTNLVFAGIEFGLQPIDATEMTHVHIDVWAPAATTFGIKLVDFGEDGVFGGAPDNEHELFLHADSSPSFAPGTWQSLDIPFTQFTNLVTRAHLAQMIISANDQTAYIANVYLHR